MRRLSLVLCLFLAGAATSRTANAFSLLGPFASWMDDVKSYQTSDAIGGPMNLGEEYRWNLPVVTYGFDESFLNYFGSNGVSAVESAIQILNALPPVSQLNLDDFPLDSTLVSLQAQQLGLLDLKSVTLSLMLEQLGLASPERYIFALREHWHTNGTTNSLVIQRNFDPVTWQPSRFVNGVLYARQLFHSDEPHRADAVELPVNPLGPSFTAVAGAHLTSGQFVTNITRDDVGGLRYLYSSGNVNIEDLIPDVRGTNGSRFVNRAPRPGVEKVTFLRINPAFNPSQTALLTNQFVDTYLTNGEPAQQTLERVLTRPDILFAAEDLGLNQHYPVYVERTGTTNWASKDALNGNVPLDGPGIIQPPVTIAFSKLGPFETDPGLGSGDSNAIPSVIWGSFGGSTNQPLAFPIRDGSLPDLSELTIQLRLTQEGSEQILPIRLLSRIGSQLSLQTSTNLSQWDDLVTATNSGGVIEFVEPITTNEPARFFRATGQ